MATITIHRSRAFKRGDLVADVLIDGHKAGSLTNSNELCLPVSEGSHTIQVRSLSIKGQPMHVTVTPGDNLDLVFDPLPVIETTAFSTISSLLCILAINIHLPNWYLEMSKLALVFCCAAISGWQMLKKVRKHLTVRLSPGNVAVYAPGAGTAVA